MLREDDADDDPSVPSIVLPLRNNPIKFPIGFSIGFSIGFYIGFSIFPIGIWDTFFSIEISYRKFLCRLFPTGFSIGIFSIRFPIGNPMGNFLHRNFQ